MSIDINQGATALQVLPTTTATAYTTGLVIGGLLTLAGAARASGQGYPAGAGSVASATVVFRETAVACDIVFFSASPTASTVTDTSALAINAADVGKVVGVLHLTDITSLGTPGIVQSAITQQPVQYALGGSTNPTLYAALVARGSITLTSTTDAVITLNVRQT